MVERKGSMTGQTRYFITGGAGFIGGHLTDFLLERGAGQVTVFDNFSTGRHEHLERWRNDPRLTVVEADARDAERLMDAMPGHDFVYHFAANSDIARAQTDPGIDFCNGTVPTHNVLEAMRLNGVKRIVFTSGSGVYGEVGPEPVAERYDRMIPVSTYGACKLACESLISAYSFMFGITGTVFRFANVVGPRQTHGVAYDFINRLHAEPARLKIFGDGTQCKPYLHVDDVLAAFLLMEQRQTGGYDVFNVGTQDQLTVREIADLVCARMGLKDTVYEYTGGARGWKADVPFYRLNTDKIRACGWRSTRNSREAVEASVDDMVKALKHR
jgi:UDP-glucose 4-epimerase